MSGPRYSEENLFRDFRLAPGADRPHHGRGLRGPGPWNTVVALVIACCKATLVVLFFMHLRWSPPLDRVVLLSALLWLAILISLTTTDFFSRYLDAGSGKLGIVRRASGNATGGKFGQPVRQSSANPPFAYPTLLRAAAPQPRHTTEAQKNRRD